MAETGGAQLAHEALIVNGVGIGRDASSGKISRRLVEHLDSTPPDKKIDVVIELRSGPMPSSDLARASDVDQAQQRKQAAAMRAHFQLDLEKVTAAIAEIGGTVLESSWLNQTILASLPPSGLRHIAEEPPVFQIDFPGDLELG